MPRLYIQEYTRLLAGRQVCIACREGVLRDHFDAIVNDIKFLNRQRIITSFFHNMPNRFANQRHFRALTNRLPETRVTRVPSDTDFYGAVLNRNPLFKLIFLERKCLTDKRGRRLNTLNTHHLRNNLLGYGDMIANTNFRAILDKICTHIEKGRLDRVHVLPARKHTIKHELFTVEGTGTLIANDFEETFAPLATEADEQLVAGILDLYKKKGYLKPRDRAYIASHRDNFYITQIDGIAVGCAELKHVDAQTAELGALAISTRFRGQRIGVFTVKAFMAEAHQRGYQRIISLTKNPRLQALYRSLGFTQQTPVEYAPRQSQSPGTPMFVKADLL